MPQLPPMPESSQHDSWSEVDVTSLAYSESDTDPTMAMSEIEESSSGNCDGSATEEEQTEICTDD